MFIKAKRIFLLLVILLSCGGDDQVVNEERENAGLMQNSMIWLESAKPEEQTYVVFRKEFNIESTLSNAELRIFADSRYRLWINGQYVERGPCRFDPKHPEYDILEVGKYLKTGDNAIAILVHHFAINSFPLWYDKCARMMHHNPGLTALLTTFIENGEFELLSTDTNWRASRHTRFQDSPGTYTSIPDNIDARLDEGDWTSQSFNDSKWHKASLINGDDWGKLAPRSIPLLRETVIIPKEICQEIVNGEINNQPKDLSNNLPLKMSAGHQVIIDVGMVVQAYPLLDFDAEENTKLEIGYATLFNQNNKTPFLGSFTGNRKTRYFAKKGFQNYMGGDTFGFRYLVLKVVSGEIVLKRIKVVDRKYPNDRIGGFYSNDSLLNRLWNICVNTVEVCSEDAYVDCADRERAQWMADGYKMNFPVSRIALATKDEKGSYHYADTRLMRNMLRHVALSQLPDGRLQPMRPSDYKAEDKHGVIDDYSCLYVQALREYYDRTSDTVFIKEMWPYAVKIIDYFLERTTENGLINAGEFIYFDNPLIYVKCEGASINSYIYGSLRDMAYLAGKMEYAQEKPRFSIAADQLVQNFNEHLWNSEGGNYYGGIIDKEHSAMADDPPSYSEPYTGELINNKFAPPTAHAALMSLYYKLVPDEKRQQVFDYMLQRSEEKQIWWPYTSRYYLDVLYAEDDNTMDIKALEYIRSSFGHMTDYETGTTSEDWKGGSFVHESGSHPAYFLSAYVLGVRTLNYEGRLQLIIQPRLGNLKKTEGSVLCEYGAVPLRWERLINGNLSFDFTIPDNTDALIYIPVQMQDNKPDLTINAEKHLVKGKLLGDGKIEGRYYLIRLKHGKYTGEVFY